MNKTHVRPVRDLRNNYSEIAKLVKNDFDHVIITNNGRSDTVLIDFDIYSQFEEFLHEKYIAQKLEEGLDRMNNSEAKWYSQHTALQMVRNKLKNRSS